MDTDLPLIDEHRLSVAASLATTWEALSAWIARTQLGANTHFTDLLGTEPRRGSGTIPELGATIPGFEVTESVPEGHITLAGRHRFSRYQLVFSTSTEAGGTIVSARSYAVFPGVLGWGYRRLVISSGAHGLIVKRMLKQIRRAAE
ncbi:hypothetical protein [Nocardia sp. 348MFTsu5.1]|uniref:hypothetical protein n=1 Tax=Nocardia sp. 348MFTsu5.1 TaxID=1172185 RepID=UPI00036D2925|nr:hypothetical protein [Nocardia sp. 348MFTsu5.1]